MGNFSVNCENYTVNVNRMCDGNFPLTFLHFTSPKNNAKRTHFIEYNFAYKVEEQEY